MPDSRVYLCQVVTEDPKTSIFVCTVSELKPGERRVVEYEGEPIVIFNCAGTLFAIEDRCSHEDAPLDEGELDSVERTIECPRHGSVFDLRSGKPKTLPAFQPVQTFPVEIINESIVLKV